MRQLLLIPATVMMLATAACSQRQVPQFMPEPLQPPAPLAPTRKVGMAEVHYNVQRNRSLAKIYTYVLGESSDVPQHKKEVITMEIWYSIDGRFARPDYVSLRLVSYSPEIPKYRENHGIRVLTNGNELIRDPGVDWYANDNPRPTASESYGISKISFADFEKMAIGSSVSIQLGATKIDINPDGRQAIQDLLKTTEN